MRREPEITCTICKELYIIGSDKECLECITKLKKLFGNYNVLSVSSEDKIFHVKEAWYNHYAKDFNQHDHPNIYDLDPRVYSGAAMKAISELRTWEKEIHEYSKDHFESFYPKSKHNGLL